MKTDNVINENKIDLNKRTKGEWMYMADINNIHIASKIFGGICTIPHNGKHIEEHEANAAFICKAVNNYDSLLSALKDAQKVIGKYLKSPDTWDINDLHIHDKIEDAISQAEQL